MVLPGTGGTVTFSYDPFGRRVQKSSSSGTTNYLYDGSNSVEELDQAGAELAHYAQGAGVDEPLAALRGGTAGFYEQDGLGSVTSLSNSSGAVLDSYIYDAFGNTTAATGSFTNSYLYTARDYDSESSLLYYRARYYSPQKGRFFSEDAVRFNGGMDFYVYADNDPIGLTDPFGFCPWQVHKRPLKGLAGIIPGTFHVYFYNNQTGQSIGLGPAGSAISGRPVPGGWETHEKPGTVIGTVPDNICNCVDNKAKHPGNPPKYCPYAGTPPENSKAPWCGNCDAWATQVLRDCYKQVHQ